MWKFHKVRKVLVFVTLFGEVSLDCRDAVMSVPLTKNHSAICLTYAENRKKPHKDNICLFRAFAFHWQGSRKLEETAKVFDRFPEGILGTDLSNFRSVCMNEVRQEMCWVNFQRCWTITLQQ